MTHLLLLINFFLADSTTNEAAALAARVTAAYRTGGDLQANFVQAYTDAVRHKTRTEKGILRVKKDGRLRWTYTGEEKKEFIFDGKSAYFFEPDSSQVTIFENFSRSPLFGALQFLWGGTKLSKDFQVRLAGPGDDCPLAQGGQSVLRLQPNQSLPAVSHVCLVVAQKEARVVSAQICDTLGNVTTYSFLDLRFGAALAEAQFTFAIAEGVHVLYAPQTTPAAAVNQKSKL